MILAAGLTPAWQQILAFDHVQLGEVNRAQTAAWCASGKVLNVGNALNALGASAKTLCPIGGPSGDLIRSDFERLRIPVRWVPFRTNTRICTTILDESTGVTTELVENSAAVLESELEDYFAAFVEEVRSASLVVISGSLPNGAPSHFYRRMLESTKAPAVLDIRGAELEQALPLRPFVVKPNREELARTVNRSLSTEADLIEAMSEVRRRGAEWVVVSQGPSPLIALGPEGVLRIQPPTVKVRNPIGCGDCLAAGIAASLDKGLSMKQALENGVRAAAENATALLPAGNLMRLP
jgi:1-phosphofructokinase family hexose kinase